MNTGVSIYPRKMHTCTFVKVHVSEYLILSTYKFIQTI